MRCLEEYVPIGQKRLRCGYTTGTCAAAAARAAAELLVRGIAIPAVTVQTPAGISVTVEIEEHEAGRNWAQCAVRKDAGDDPDTTDGLLVRVRVERCADPGIHIVGGEGVGRVTRAGLDQPVGEAAINSVPRTMIEEQVKAALEETTVEACLLVTVSVPEGARIAGKTFNPRLGIEGGISILGTSGIVKPMSEEALVAAIELELRMLVSGGAREALVVPGNYGRDFAREKLGLPVEQAVSCSNYFGDTIDAAVRVGLERMLIVGHLGKMVKVAGGVMNTHSRVADCRMEVLAAHAALMGAGSSTTRGVMAAATTEAALDVLVDEGLMEDVSASLMAALAERLAFRAGDALQVEAVVFSQKRGLLGKTAGAEQLIGVLRKAGGNA